MVDKVRRAQEARRVLDEPLFIEALNALEAEAVEAMVSAKGWRWGDRQRRVAAEQIRVIRGIRHHLEMVIINGQQRPRVA